MAAELPNLATEKITFRHTQYRAEKRLDPSDGQSYTWSLLQTWYLQQGWKQQDIEHYWNTLDIVSTGRTRNKNKELLPDNHGYVKKRKQDTARGSNWVAY